jgi:hypothetical protein
MGSHSAESPKYNNTMSLLVVVIQKLNMGRIVSEAKSSQKIHGYINC